uniref:Retrovirus-related Pol polyprotein from transposon TNT 1-94 n=1 Tax=Tanacetum cinerariifolium TaxID=118510 RepID=A0A6L2KKV4_TANCI|nr:retrovirus-related Pol polyprotein from transposon TNT 1-94 [Tanacetum cinerariifolium]
MILESVEHGPLIWPTVEENGMIRTNKYAELSAAEKIQVDYDMKTTNIILQVLPTDIYSLMNHYRVAKDLWERVQLLMQDVKLVKDLHTSNYDQLNAYLKQHEIHANETEDLDTYDSDCDDLSNAHAVLMANISNYGSDVILEATVQDTNLQAQQGSMILSVIEQIVEVPIELPKVSLVNESLKKLKFQLAQFDSVVKKRTTPNALTEDIVSTIMSCMSLNVDCMNVDIQRSESCEKCLNLDVESSKSKQAYNDLLNKYSQLEKHCMSLEVSIQLKQEVFQNDESCVCQNAPEIPEYFEKNDLKAQLKDKDTTICIVEQDKAKQPLDNELDFACKHAKRIQELLVYVQDTCPSAIRLSETKVARTPMNKIKKVTFAEPIAASSTNQETHDSNKPMLVKCSTSASGSKPSSNTKNNRISQPSSSNKINKVEDQPRSIKTRKNNKNRVKKVKCDAHVMQSSSNANSVSVSINNALLRILFTLTNVVPPKQPTSHSDAIQKPEIKVYCRKPKNVKHIDSECSKHMTGNRSQLMNFVSKFLGTIRFGNDQITRIMGYGDYQLGNVVISRVYYVNGLEHNLFFVGQFYDANIEVAFQKNTCFIRDVEDGLARGIPRLKFQKDHLCSACALGKIKKSSHQPKAEGTNQEKLYLLHMDLCGLMRVASINEKRYILVIVDDYSRFTWNGVVKRRNQTLVEATRTTLIFSKALLFLWTEAINIACYIQNRSLIRHRYNKTPYELMQHKKPDLSFLYVFGSRCYPINDHEDLGKFVAKEDIGIFVGYSPVKKAFRIYNRRTLIISKIIHAIFDELTSMASKKFSSGLGLHVMTPATPSTGLVSNPVSQQHCIPPNRDDWDRLFQPIWTKDHPIANVIGDPSRFVSTRKQLETDSMWCYFDAFLSSVEPKNFKQAMTEPSWIDAMQEEIHEFERLEVWELVPCPDNVFLIKLKWIYKIKTEESSGVLKNKARLVTQGFRQEEGIDFEESFAPLLE